MRNKKTDGRAGGWSRRALNLSLLGATVACAGEAAPAAVPGPRPAPPVRFRRGIGVHHMLSFPRLERGSETRFVWPPYEEADYRSTDAELANLARVGFDFVRLTIGPEIFMATDRQRAVELHGILRATIERFRNAGLNVIADLHPTHNSSAYNPERIVSSEFPRYLDVVGRVAATLSGMGEGVAFELMNEPPLYGDSGARRWGAMAVQLAEIARSAAPNLTLVMTGHDMSSFEALTELTPLPPGMGPILYTFHYYNPAMFTHQTQIDSVRHVAGLEWPSNPARRQEQRDAAARRVAADPDLAPFARPGAVTEAHRALDTYYNAETGPQNVEWAFGLVSDWADRHGIPHEAILVGEFGAVRTHWQYEGADEPSRLLWLETVRRQAEAKGFGWAAWVYRGYGGMAITAFDDPMSFDPGTLRALGLSS